MRNTVSLNSDTDFPKGNWEERKERKGKDIAKFKSRTNVLF